VLYIQAARGPGTMQSTKARGITVLCDQQRAKRDRVQALLWPGPWRQAGLAGVSWISPLRLRQGNIKRDATPIAPDGSPSSGLALRAVVGVGDGNWGRGKSSQGW